MNKQEFPEDSSEPIAYVSGTVMFNPQFKALKELRDVLPLCNGLKRNAIDLGLYLFFVHSPRSIHSKKDESERLALCFMEKRFADPEWLRGVLDEQPVLDLVEKYKDLVQTPAMRLRQNLISAINRYINEIAAVKGTDENINMDKLIDRGIDLFRRIKEVEAILNEEPKKKIRAGYTAKMFERLESNVESAA